MGRNASEASDGARKQALHDTRRSIRYRLTLELRRLERNGRGGGTYAGEICRALDELPRIKSESVLKLLERELDNAEASQREQPYASVLSSIFSRVDEHEPSCSQLFAYYLERLEAQGRGHEPFANALRRALKSHGTRVSTPVLFDDADYTNPDDKDSDDVDTDHDPES